MHRLKNVIRNYEWGSHTHISSLLGAPTPSQKPEAELWLGAHPQASSILETLNVTFNQAIVRDAKYWIGAQSQMQFGDRLPFLLKILAAAQPLSLQAHPSKSQAERGFKRENDQGIPLAAAHRNYKDDNHKPELLCALEPFEALCGFRTAAQTGALFQSLRVESVQPILNQLQNADGVRSAFSHLMSLDKDVRKKISNEVGAAAKRASLENDSFRWAAQLSELYPDDIGVAASLFLNFVKLKPFEAIYLGAGNLHAYLKGCGVEIMANSDNVLRGGCTPKHVDVHELMQTLDFAPLENPVVQATESTHGEFIFQTPAPEFRLSYFKNSVDAHLSIAGAEILICVDGEFDISNRVKLSKGESLAIPFETGGYSVQGGGIMFRARRNA